ncbi:hypothetical protein FC65_GL002150 [Ligilactobacillus acidipiscis DSM 15836]|uniref:Uncharacterized protein n=1 Tax=Ligilactobacillus acidipiscis DSM 15836 TaxID=1423716 RepID=A0ABR5PKQ5_9LACO|nr:hypothetical protein FC65_GL002150 [Ligilactobacillus acidipiscis DSM 15836]
MSLVYGGSTDKELTWIKFEIFVWVINGEYFGCKLGVVQKKPLFYRKSRGFLNNLKI